MLTTSGNCGYSAPLGEKTPLDPRCVQLDSVTESLISVHLLVAGHSTAATLPQFPQQHFHPTLVEYGSPVQAGNYESATLPF